MTSEPVNVQEELQKMYGSEINVTITWMWDNGIDVKLGHEFTGYAAEGHVIRSQRLCRG